LLYAVLFFKVIIVMHYLIITHFSMKAFFNQLIRFEPATVDLVFVLFGFCFILAQKGAALYIKFYLIHEIWKVL